jgi:hypothetical protein
VKYENKNTFSNQGKIEKGDKNIRPRNYVRRFAHPIIILIFFMPFRHRQLPIAIKLKSKKSKKSNKEMKRKSIK